MVGTDVSCAPIKGSGEGRRLKEHVGVCVVHPGGRCYCCCCCLLCCSCLLACAAVACRRDMRRGGSVPRTRNSLINARICPSVAHDLSLVSVFCCAWLRATADPPFVDSIPMLGTLCPTPDRQSPSSTRFKDFLPQWRNESKFTFLLWRPNTRPHTLANASF